MGIFRIITMVTMMCNSSRIKKENHMLIELKSVEAHIQAEEILKEALQEGEISVKRVIEICEDEEGDESVLDEIDNDRIRAYSKSYDLNISLDSYAQVVSVVDDFAHQDKALLLWHLLNSKGADSE